MKLGLLIPEFPTQTHIAMWRVGRAMRELGVDVRILSTRRPTEGCEHAALLEEAQHVHYVFPPAAASVARAMLRSPAGWARCGRYVAGLNESGLRGRAVSLPLMLCAADLAEHCRSEGIGHVFVHSCAQAAHVVAMARLLGGPAYSLRLGGDLSVYGTDHRSKMRGAAFIAAAAEPTRREVIERVGLAPERVYAMWLGVDTRRFVPAERQAGVEQPTGPLRIVTVCRLNRAKGLPHAIRAVRMAVDQGADVQYTIIGSGPEEAALRRQIEGEGLTERVHLVGSKGEDQVIRALQEHDAFVLASVHKGEASPAAVLEAMAAGLPAVCTIIGGTADIVTDGADGFLVEQRDEPAMADRLVRLARDAALRRRMGQAARRRAVADFDCLRTAERLCDAITTHTGWDPRPDRSAAHLAPHAAAAGA